MHNLSYGSLINYIIIVQVLSSTVANAFSYYSLEETEETEKFVRYFDKFFDCLNVRSLSECVHSRKPDLRPYRSPDDPRLQVIKYVIFIIYYTCYHVISFVFKWLKDDFLSYIDSWESSVQSREGYTASQKNMMLLSRETREGLRITGMLYYIRYQVKGRS